MNDTSQLKFKLNKLAQIFDFKKVLSTKTDTENISNYYRINRVPYTIFHTNKDLVHMGISRDLKYKEEDLLEQAKFVAGYIDFLKPGKVLEQACGRGANSLYLAKKYPNVRFVGLDLPNGHADLAKSKSKQVSNFGVLEGDYHDLNRFEAGSFDLVFIVEALCHSQNKEEVFRQVKRVLKPGGVFIVFDAYFRGRPETLDSTTLLACDLIAKGMMVEKFEYYGDFKSYAENTGFKLIHEEDVTKFVLPTTERFERGISLALRVPFLASIIHAIFPSIFTNNAISGYLMADSIRLNIAIYAITVFEA